MPEALVPRRSVRRFPTLNVILFLGTLFSTILAGGLPWALEHWPVQGLTFEAAWSMAGGVARAGLPFSASLLAILLSHEMGHYVLARVHRVESTLPYFIPFPFSQVGTLGAVIRMRSAIPSRAAVLDIGAAGPFAGFVIAAPLFAWGIAHSEVRLFTETPSGRFGMGLVSWIYARLSTGSWPRGGGDVLTYGDSLLTWGMQRLLLGPLPPGASVIAHPVAMAAFFGLLVTTLNLFPLGQLDGGHVVYALFGRRRAVAISRFVSWGLLGCSLFVSWTWLPWWLVTRLVIKFHHPPAETEEILGPGRTALAVLALIVFVVTFIPIPVSM